MAKPESNHRAYPRFATGYVGQQGYYRRLADGRDPLCVGATGWYVGPNQIFVEGGDFRSVAAVKQKVLLVTAGGVAKRFRLASLVFDAGVTKFVLDQLHGLTDVVGAYLLDADPAREGWAQLADMVDDDVATLGADRQSLRATFLALKQRLDAVVSDAGAASTITRPAAEFLPLNIGPLAIAPSTTISAATDPAFGDSFRLVPDPKPALAALGLTNPMRIRFQTTGGPVLSMIWDDGVGEDGSRHFVCGYSPLPAINTITDVEFSIVRDGAGQYADAHFPEGVIASSKFVPALAHQSDYAALLDALDIPGVQARMTAAEGGLTGHVSSREAHGAASALIGDGEMESRIVDHNERFEAHRGGAFATIQARVLRGVAGGYVPLDGDGYVPAEYLAGPFGVKRVLTGSVSIGSSLKQTSYAWAELTTDPFDPARTFVTLLIETQSASVEASTFVTAVLGDDNASVMLERASTGDQVTASLTLVEFYG